MFRRWLVIILVFGVATLSTAATLTDIQIKRKAFYGDYFKEAGKSHKDNYEDGYNKYFWLWIQDQPTKEKALWVHHHQNDINPKRIKKLLKKDRSLENEIVLLRDVRIDPIYKPKGVDVELMYLTFEELKNKPITQEDIWIGICGLFILLATLLLGLKICGV